MSLQGENLQFNSKLCGVDGCRKLSRQQSAAFQAYSSGLWPYKNVIF